MAASRRLSVWVPGLLCACLAAAAARAGERGAARPSPSELESGFATPETGAQWTFVPGSPEATRVLRAAAPWDLRGVAAISVRARVVRQERQAVRLRWAVASRVGLYSSAHATPVPIVGALADVRVVKHVVLVHPRFGEHPVGPVEHAPLAARDRKSTRLNSSH
jgi:hypothetical protein